MIIIITTMGKYLLKYSNQTDNLRTENRFDASIDNSGTTFQFFWVQISQPHTIPFGSHRSPPSIPKFRQKTKYFTRGGTMFQWAVARFSGIIAKYFLINIFGIKGEHDPSCIGNYLHSIISNTNIYSIDSAITLTLRYIINLKKAKKQTKNDFNCFRYRCKWFHRTTCR